MSSLIRVRKSLIDRYKEKTAIEAIQSTVGLELVDISSLLESSSIASDYLFLN